MIEPLGGGSVGRRSPGTSPGCLSEELTPGMTTSMRQSSAGLGPIPVTGKQEIPGRVYLES